MAGDSAGVGLTKVEQKAAKLAAPGFEPLPFNSALNLVCLGFLTTVLAGPPVSPTPPPHPVNRTIWSCELKLTFRAQFLKITADLMLLFVGLIPVTVTPRPSYPEARMWLHYVWLGVCFLPVLRNRRFPGSHSEDGAGRRQKERSLCPGIALASCWKVSETSQGWDCLISSPQGLVLESSASTWPECTWLLAWEEVGKPCERFLVMCMEGS